MCDTTTGTQTTVPVSQLKQLVKNLAHGYLDLYVQIEKKKEFFGLRDFYRYYINVHPMHNTIRYVLII